MIQGPRRKLTKRAVIPARAVRTVIYRKTLKKM
jgi:hypothetical protein